MLKISPIKETFLPLNGRTELQQPAFSVGVEERVRQIVAVIFWDFEGFVFDAVVEVLQTDEAKNQSRGNASRESSCLSARRQRGRSSP